MVNIITDVKDVEIRGIEKKQSKQGNEYLIVSIDDNRGKRSELYCRDVGKESEYTRGKIGTARVEITVGKFAKVELLDFTQDTPF
jgi:hypothetical protein